MKTIDSLNALSPIDGRYRNQTEPLCQYFSEFALIRYRVVVEVEYFIALCNLPLPQLKRVGKKDLRKFSQISKSFSPADAERIKEIEKKTNHDVKAVEYFVKEKLEQAGLGEYREFVHFGLTSQDINNTAIPLTVKDALNSIYLTKIASVVNSLKSKVKEWRNIPMLSRTHGQPATPTRLGKEIDVFVQRLNGQLKLLKSIPITSKFSGATGGFNAHYAAYPDIDWLKFAREFQKERFGLVLSYPTTQIEPYDNLAALFDNLKRINTILIDLCRDVWSYISMEYLGQKISANEVGSSAMPHKVNPIDFENAEGNLGIANALLGHFSTKLPISRLQRDLTDSTTLRNIGVAFGHILISMNSILKGLDKLTINEPIISEDLERHPEVLAEAIQTILRRESYPEPYEKLKELTRNGNRMTLQQIREFIDGLEIEDDIKEELRRLTPRTYIGK